MGFIARATKIEIADLAGRQHAKAVIAFRRQIDPTVRCSGRDEEDRLLADHLDMLVVQCFEKFGHTALVPKQGGSVQS